MARDIAVACGLLFAGIVLVAYLDGGPLTAVPAPSAPSPAFQDATLPSTLLADLEREEGFRGQPYDDSLGFGTIGFGTKLPLTRTEAEMLLRHRLAIGVASFCGQWGSCGAMPPHVLDALAEMSYQLGVSGLLEFHDMLRLLEERDWTAAADAALQSRWASETPARAERVAGVIREGR